jgi:hypothetical protein
MQMQIMHRGVGLLLPLLVGAGAASASAKRTVQRVLLTNIYRMQQRGVRMVLAQLQSNLERSCSNWKAVISSCSAS